MFCAFVVMLTVPVILTDAGRILAVLPTPSISHQIVFRPLMLELAKRGHEVTVITTDPMLPEDLENLKEIDVHDISYSIWNNYTSVVRGMPESHVAQLKHGLKLLGAVFEAQVKSPEVQKLINDKSITFDLLFTETCVRPSLSFAYIYDVPVIEFSSFGGIINTYELLGSVEHPFHYPVPVQQRLQNLNFWEKISEIVHFYSMKHMYTSLENDENKMLQATFGPDIPTLSELRKKIHLHFFNVNPVWDFNRPVPPNVIYLGGLHKKPNTPLPKNIQTILDTSKHGVIYISFGTNVKPSLLAQEKMRIFTKVLSELSYDVLWKWDKEEFPECPRNVRISKWYPQSDLLKHPKIRLFITQGGLQSSDEAIAAAVPVIGVPLLGDQWYNVEQYIIHGIGLGLDLASLTEDKLRNAINATVNDPRYKKNALKLRSIVTDQPQTPLERAVWWTEYMLRHGDATKLKTRTVGIHWTRLYELEIILSTLFIGFTICIVTIVLAVQYVIRHSRLHIYKVKKN